MNKLYALVFDNDEEFPGVLQFYNVASDEDFLQGAGTNVSEDLEYVQKILSNCKEHHPQYNYRTVEIIVKDIAMSQFLSDVVTAAGLLSHGKTDKVLARRISEFAFNLM